MTFDYIFRLNITGYSWIFLTVTVFHYIFGIHYVYEKIFQFDSKEAEEVTGSYHSFREQFLAEYDRCNPLTA
jgi:hypothetical protein